MKNNTIEKIEITQNQICYAKSNKFISILFHLDSIYVRSFESLLQLILIHLRLKNVSYSISACKFGRGKKIWIMKIRIFSCRSLGFGEKQLWKRVHDYFKHTETFKSILKFIVTWWSCFFNNGLYIKYLLLFLKNFYTFENLLQCLLIFPVPMFSYWCYKLQ